MSITSLKPGYTPLIQKAYCCAPTVLQMVLYRNGYGLYDQETIAVELGVKVSDKDGSAFKAAMPVFTSLNHDEGIKTIDSQDRINKFFKTHAVGLAVQSVRGSSISSLKDFLKEQIEKGRDLWIEYHTNETRNGTFPDIPTIHDGLIESINYEDGQLTLINPLFMHRQRQTFPVDMLVRAISDLYGRETGFLIVEKKTPALDLLP